MLDSETSRPRLRKWQKRNPATMLEEWNLALSLNHGLAFHGHSCFPSVNDEELLRFELILAQALPWLRDHIIKTLGSAATQLL